MGKVRVYRPGIGLFCVLILGFFPRYPLQTDLDAFKDHSEKTEKDQAEDPTPFSEESSSSEKGKFLCSLLV